MPFTRISGVRFESVSACVPSNTVDNMQSGGMLFSGNELKNVLKATGIEKRRICKNSGTTALDLSLKAAEDIFENTGLGKDEIGAVVFVTFTPDNQMPNNATLVQKRLGLSNFIPAFDINLACSGYVYGLWVASMMAVNLNKKVLFLDGEKQSHITSQNDKSTALLMGDAGSATVLSPAGKNGCEWFFSFETYGEDREALYIPAGGARSPLKKEDLEYVEDETGSSRRNIDIRMDGMEVFRFVIQKVSSNIKNIMEDTRINEQDVDFFAFHQANEYMLRQISKRNNIPFSKVPISIDRYGNSSSTTVPVTICSERKEQIRETRNRVLLSGFGGGLSIGTGIIDMDKVYCGGIIEYEE